VSAKKRKISTNKVLERFLLSPLVPITKGRKRGCYQILKKGRTNGTTSQKNPHCQNPHYNLQYLDPGRAGLQPRATADVAKGFQLLEGGGLYKKRGWSHHDAATRWHQRWASKWHLRRGNRRGAVGKGVINEKGGEESSLFYSKKIPE